ncbi:MAG: WG repeat-containing protein [Clostridiales bacterium]|jgi:hypothetical protein|nr:WG repeat-containing protein [Clostridiales bacterium]
MKKRLIIAAFGALLIVFITGCFGGNAGNGAEDGLVWRVPPSLEFDSIERCSCGRFFTREQSGDRIWQNIDPQMGLLADYHNGHGAGPFEWVYDPQLGLFGHRANNVAYGIAVGMHPLDEFTKAMEDLFWHDDWAWTLEWILSTSDRLIAVQNVDFSKRVPYWDLDDDAWWLDDDAFLGQAALMYDREFVTGFIFDEISQLQWYFNIRNDFEFVAARIGDRWGLIDKNGDVVIDFIFENLLLIDEDTAFARYNVLYGILDVENSIKTINLEG